MFLRSAREGSTSQGGSGTFTSDGFSASGYETVDLGSGSGPRPGDTSYGGGGPGDMSGRIDPSPHGGGPGADYQAPGMQSPMSAPQGINMSGQSWSPSNNGSPSSSGGSQSSQPLPTPGAGSPGRTNGNVNGSGATSAPLPYTPNSPAWLQEAASLAVTMSLTPAAKLVLESFGAAEGGHALGRGVSTFGRASIGAAERGFGRALQTGGNTIKPGTAKALNEALGFNFHPREWGRALEGLKDWKGLSPNFHQTKILESGNVVNSQTGKVLGNLLEFLP